MSKLRIITRVVAEVYPVLAGKCDIKYCNLLENVPVMFYTVWNR